MMQMSPYLASVPFYASATCRFDLLKTAVRDRRLRVDSGSCGREFVIAQIEIEPRPSVGFELTNEDSVAYAGIAQ